MAKYMCKVEQNMGNNEYIVDATRISNNLNGNDLDTNGGCRNPNVSKPKVKKPRGMPQWFKEWSENSLENKIVNVIKATVPDMIAEGISTALKPVVSRLDNIEMRLSNVETTIQDHSRQLSKINKVVFG